MEAFKRALECNRAIITSEEALENAFSTCLIAYDFHANNNYLVIQVSKI